MASSTLTVSKPQKNIYHLQAAYRKQQAEISDLKKSLDKREQEIPQIKKNLSSNKKSVWLIAILWLLSLTAVGWSLFRLYNKTESIQARHYSDRKNRYEWRV